MLLAIFGSLACSQSLRINSSKEAQEAEGGARAQAECLTVVDETADAVLVNAVAESR